VRYYRRPPVYFRGWASDAPPRWGEHWGNAWEQHHRGWDNWNRRAVPARAPLPAYQRQYSGNRYPSVVQQQQLQTHNYRYQPRDAVVRQHYQAQRAQSHPPPSVQGATRAPRGQPPQSGSREVQQRAAPAPSHQGGPTAGPQRQQAGHAVPQHQQQAPRSQNHGHAQEPKRGQTKGGDQGDQRGGERSR
jgi:hypothetical protein